LGDGASNNDITEALTIRPKTVARHHDNLMS
jgi:DNA-binding NarL/FixJ family response regulator